MDRSSQLCSLRSMRFPTSSRLDFDRRQWPTIQRQFPATWTSTRSGRVCKRKRSWSERWTTCAGCRSDRALIDRRPRSRSRDAEVKVSEMFSTPQAVGALVTGDDRRLFGNGVQTTKAQEAKDSDVSMGYENFGTFVLEKSSAGWRDARTGIYAQRTVLDSDRIPLRNIAALSVACARRPALPAADRPRSGTARRRSSCRAALRCRASRRAAGVVRVAAAREREPMRRSSRRRARRSARAPVSGAISVLSKTNGISSACADLNRPPMKSDSHVEQVHEHGRRAAGGLALGEPDRRDAGRLASVIAMHELPRRGLGPVRL